MIKIKGSIKFFKEEKGFGFIEGSDGKEYFFHISSLKNQITPEKNDEVDFVPSKNQKGLMAVDVVVK